MTELNIPQPGLPGGGSQDKQLIKIAIAVSLLLHLAIGAATWHISLVPDFQKSQDRAQGDEVELVFEDTPSADPSTYVSVPDRQAVAESPEKPKYLALHHSIAADNEMGDAEQPSATEESAYEKVEINKEDLAGAGGVAFSPQPNPQEKPATHQREPGTKTAAENEAVADEQVVGGEVPVSAAESAIEDEKVTKKNDTEVADHPDLEDWWGGQREASILKAGTDGSAGDRGFDFNQSASGAMTSGVAVIDQFQLSTVEWDWGPWVQVFGNELHRHWVPPYAYRLGLIDGTTVIRLVIEKDGRPSSLVVLDRQGHESLHEASVAALRAFAPYKPLPAGFPEENLVITLSLHYPAFRH